jgi:hypothetical protein
MATWKKLTALDNKDVFVNLDNVLSLAWHANGHGTIVTYAGVEKDHIIVKETPEEIIRAGTAA